VKLFRTLNDHIAVYIHLSLELLYTSCLNPIEIDSRLFSDWNKNTLFKSANSQRWNDFSVHCKKLDKFIHDGLFCVFFHVRTSQRKTSF